MYIAKLNYCHAEEDSYKEGCIGKLFEKTYTMEFTSDSLEGVKEKIKEFHGFEELECEDDIYRSAIHEDEGGMRATEEDFELWKKGKRRLFYVETGYKIYKCEQVTE